MIYAKCLQTAFLPTDLHFVYSFRQVLNDKDTHKNVNCYKFCDEGYRYTDETFTECSPCEKGLFSLE